MLNTTQLTHLNTIADNRFSSDHHQENPNGSLFGGQIVAQSVMAACRVLKAKDSRLLHSLHCYFVAPGHNKEPVEFEVTTIKEGHHFSVFCVNAWQQSRMIFYGHFSFHNEERAFLNHTSSIELPTRLTHEQLADIKALTKDKAYLYQYSHNSLFDILGTVRYPALFFDNGENKAECWLRGRDVIDSSGNAIHDTYKHTALLSASSDMGILYASLSSRLPDIDRQQLQIASLDHSLWIHRRVNMNEWHYLVSESVWADRARALVQARIFNEQGELVASVAQEGSVRHS